MNIQVRMVDGITYILNDVAPPILETEYISVVNLDDELVAQFNREVWIAWAPYEATQ